ncbi:MAG: hypothetical protein AAB875_01965, partial [Patescibacteria group bacterium]
ASMKAFMKGYEETFPAPVREPIREPITDMGGSDEYDNRRYQRQNKYWPCSAHGTTFEAKGKNPPHRSYCKKCLDDKNAKTR